MSTHRFSFECVGLEVSTIFTTYFVQWPETPLQWQKKTLNEWWTLIMAKFSISPLYLFHTNYCSFFINDNTRKRAVYATTRMIVLWATATHHTMQKLTNFMKYVTKTHFSYMPTEKRAHIGADWIFCHPLLWPGYIKSKHFQLISLFWSFISLLSSLSLISFLPPPSLSLVSLHLFSFHHSSCLTSLDTGVSSYYVPHCRVHIQHTLTIYVQHVDIFWRFSISCK